MSSATFWIAGTRLLGTLVYLGFEIALLTIAIAVIRKHRPEAWGWFAGAAGIEMLETLSHWLVGAPGMMLVASAGEISAVPLFNAAMSAFYALLRATASFFLLYGIMRLAKPSEVPFPNS